MLCKIGLARSFFLQRELVKSTKKYIVLSSQLAAEYSSIRGRGRIYAGAKSVAVKWRRKAEQVVGFVSSSSPRDPELC